MCGIVGYIGNKPAQPILLNGLRNLEYRGYDSAGIATLEKNQILILKDMGRVSHLTDIVKKEESLSCIGIAHTRWATHGKATKENAHPHLDNSNTFAVVHNGIIENYEEIKKFLISNNYEFKSQTDTEVIPNLIHYFYNKNNDFLVAVQLACKQLQGSYSLCILCKLEPNKIIVTKKDSPLVIGKGINENYIGSDIPAILSYTKDFYFLDDFEIAEIYSTKIVFYNNNLENIDKTSQIVDLDQNSAQKNGFEDFMLKEINEQPIAICKTIQEFDSNFDFNIIKNYDKINIIACGTAMHAGLVRKKNN